MTEHTAPVLAEEAGQADSARLDSTGQDGTVQDGAGQDGAGQDSAGQSGASSAGGVPEVEDVLEALRDVVDPELGVNVVDLGLVYNVTVESDRTATIDMTLTSAACPLTDEIEYQATMALDGLVPDFRINWVWLPPWGPEKITEDGREQLRALGFNV